MAAAAAASARATARSPRVLVDAGLATLLIDLLTGEEEVVDVRTARLRFDIGLLAERLVGADRLAAPRRRAVTELPVGCFGASTGRRGGAGRGG